MTSADSQSRDERVNDYVDGLLSDEEARAFEAKMAQDDALLADVESLRALLRDAAELPMSIAPCRDLWTDIAPRLEGRVGPSRSRKNWMIAVRALGGIAAAVIVFAAGIWYADLRNGDGETVPTVAVAPENGTSIEPASYRQVENQYAGIRATLRAELEKARPNLAPETVRVIDDSLAVIDKAISDIETALASDPGNDALIRSLVAVYDQEVGMLEQVTRLAAEPAENKA